MTPLVLGSSRKHFVRLLLTSLAFVVGGIFLILMPSLLEKLTGASSIFFFGGCAVMFVWRMRETGPRLIINDDGVFDRFLNVGVIRWEDIYDVHVRTVNRQCFMSIRVIDEAKYVARMNPLQQRLREVNRKLGFIGLSVNLAGIEADPHSIAELIVKEIELRKTKSGEAFR